MGYRLTILGTVAVLVQVITCQCIGNYLNAGPGRGLGKGLYGSNLSGVGGLNSNLAGFGPTGVPGGAASTGGSFAVTSASPVSPTGVSVLAENLAIEGPLAVGGNLPFLGTVGLEGAMHSAGVGTVSYGCGSGTVDIVENVGVAGPYGLAGSPTAGVYSGASPYSLGGAGPVAPFALSAPSTAIASPFGIGSPIRSPGSTFSSGFGSNGFNGIGGKNGLW